MKTFDDLKVGDSIYEIDLIDNNVKALTIIELSDTYYDENSKWFRIESDKDCNLSLLFKKQAFTDSNMSKTKMWFADEDFKDYIVYIYGCGIKYKEKQIKKALGI